MDPKLVSAVIPGRNCARTIRSCLGAVAPLLEGTHLGEILFVDDASSDETATIVAQFPVTVVAGAGIGRARR